MEIEQQGWLKEYIFLAERCELLFKMSLSEFQGLMIQHHAQEQGIQSAEAFEEFVKKRYDSKDTDILTESAIAYANCQFKGGEI